MFQSPLDNERIKRQQGAMIFSSLLTVLDEEKEDYYKLVKKKEYSSTDLKSMEQFRFIKGDIKLRSMFEEKEFHIIHQYKEDILNELNMVGINEAFLFPELEHQFKTIKYQNVPQSEWIEIK